MDSSLIQIIFSLNTIEINNVHDETPHKQLITAHFFQNFGCKFGAIKKDNHERRKGFEFY